MRSRFLRGHQLRLRNPIKVDPSKCHLIGKTGSKHPRWKGGNDQYRGPESEWNAARAEKLARAGGKCEECGTTKQVVVHHIEAPEDNVSWDNSQSNLVAMCRSCHVKHHRPRFGTGRK